MRIAELAVLKKPVANPRELVSEYRFELEGIPVTITIKLYRHLSTGEVTYTQSHLIRTPLQERAVQPDRTVYPTATLAIEDAVNSLASCHRKAVEQGMTPEASWLVVNEAF
jgi:hypothetical protein